MRPTVVNKAEDISALVTSGFLPLHKNLHTELSQKVMLRLDGLPGITIHRTLVLTIDEAWEQSQPISSDPSDDRETQ